MRDWVAGDVGAGAAGEGLELDHIVVAVTDLTVASRLLNQRYGLASSEGGRHELWGTANRILPLGDAYLELIAVTDHERARGSAFGRWVLAAAPAPLRPLGWAVRTGALGDVALRLGLTVTTGSRARADGTILRWRLAGVDRASAEPILPFFIQWGKETPHPSSVPVTHEVVSVRVARLEVEGDALGLAAWLNGARLPVAVRPGAPAVVGVTLECPAGEITIDARLR